MEKMNKEQLEAEVARIRKSDVLLDLENVANCGDPLMATIIAAGQEISSLRRQVVALGGYLPMHQTLEGMDFPKLYFQIPTNTKGNSYFKFNVKKAEKRIVVDKATYQPIAVFAVEFSTPIETVQDIDSGMVTEFYEELVKQIFDKIQKC